MCDETVCDYVSSYGILKCCQVRSMTPQFCRYMNYNFDPQRDDMPDYTVIYVCNADMRPFYEIFHNIKRKFVLVSGDADETFPIDVLSKEQYEEMLNSDKLVHWYAQNCIVANGPKVSKIPIGLDYHSISRGDHEWGEKKTPIAQEIEINNLQNKALPFWTRELKCYCNFHFLLNTKFAQDRFDAMREIPIDLLFYEPEKTKRINCYNNQINYAFVISPHGNGYDCHRTWESLVLGNIVIIKSSPLDELYQDLPVWIVKDWSEVTLPRMKEIIEEFSTRTFAFEKLTLKYWREKFYSHNRKYIEERR